MPLDPIRQRYSTWNASVWSHHVMTSSQASTRWLASHLTDTYNSTLKQDSEPKARTKEPKIHFLRQLWHLQGLRCTGLWRGLVAIASCRSLGTEVANEAATLLRLTEPTQTYPLHPTPSNTILLQARISEHSSGSPQNHGAQQTSR
jgi:hypothetical protein